MGLIARATLRTDVGVVRERNEDAAHVDERGRFVVVADGMGGHGAGDVASAMAVDLVRQAMEAETPLLAAYTLDPTLAGRTLLAAQMRRALEHANAEVFARSEREHDKHQMGSTLELVVLCGSEAFIAHVGDSRTYLIRDGRAAQLTSDHTVAETMRRAGTLSTEEAEVSPMRSVLSNAIGVTPTVSVDLLRVTLRHGDRLLVCSDGLHDYFTREELASQLSGGDPDEMLEAMVERARQAGGHDNITGVVVEARNRPAATEPPVAPDPLDEETTNPISVPVPSSVPALLDGISDASVANFIDQSLAEQSRPHKVKAGEPAREKNRN